MRPFLCLVVLLGLLPPSTRSKKSELKLDCGRKDTESKQHLPNLITVSKLGYGECKHE